jgi:hypothetical protein
VEVSGALEECPVRGRVRANEIGKSRGEFSNVSSVNVVMEDKIGEESALVAQSVAAELDAKAAEAFPRRAVSARADHIIVESYCYNKIAFFPHAALPSMCPCGLARAPLNISPDHFPKYSPPDSLCIFSATLIVLFWEPFTMTSILSSLLENLPPI